MGPALGLAARGKEFGFCRQLHAKPLLKVKGDVVSFLCYRFSGCGGGAGRTSPRLPPSCMGQAAPSPLALHGSRVHWLAPVSCSSVLSSLSRTLSLHALWCSHLSDPSCSLRPSPNALPVETRALDSADLGPSPVLATSWQSDLDFLF